MLRRLHPEQPDSFAFTSANQAWAEAQITKYPEGRQASAIIPLLWRAQEQEGWLTKPAIEHVAEMLGMAYIRALEVASFYFMFQLQPVGSVAHIQVCGTTSCMICGAEDLVAVCREKIADRPHQVSSDGKLSWEEVECLGACANAPMVQIGKDYYEDLTAARLREIIDGVQKGDVPLPGPQNGRYASEPKSGLTSLEGFAQDKVPQNASVALAEAHQDTIKRIDGTEVPLITPWRAKGSSGATPVRDDLLGPSGAAAGPRTGVTDRGNVPSAPPKPAPKPTRAPAAAAPDAGPGTKPATLAAARDGGPDDLKLIKGVGPKLEALLHRLGFFHFDQVAAWTADEVAWVDQNLEGFKGRVSRDNWVDQAQALATGKETEFSQRAKKDGIYE